MRTKEVFPASTKIDTGTRAGTSRRRGGVAPSCAAGPAGRPSRIGTAGPERGSISAGYRGKPPLGEAQPARRAGARAVDQGRGDGLLGTGRLHVRNAGTAQTLTVS